ncbi:MAG: hypothetical protein FJX67_00255 [Alphaproteobacteria bacterium]|nr:hypothetical protein [Alphaproteobacteria bacterium]
MKITGRLPAAAAAAALVATLGLTQARADTAADFYRGKTVTLVVASSLGASLGLYGQLVVDQIGKYIPGNPTVIIQPRPGGGGTVGVAHVFNVAPKDGTVFCLILAPSVVMPLFRDVKFDASKFRWVGSITQRPVVVSVLDNAPARTLADARKTEVILGSSGKGSETYLAPALMNEMLGTKLKIVTGYQGGADINIAMERGEVHGRMQYWGGWTSVKADWLRDGKLFHFLQYGPKIADLPNVPSFRDLVKTDEERQIVDLLEVSPNIGMAFFMAPGVPDDRYNAMRKAFEDLMKDAAFKESVVSKGLEFGPIAADELARITERAYRTPKPIIERMRDIFGFPG